MKPLKIIFKIFSDLKKSTSLTQAILVLIICLVGLLALLISAIKVFLPFTYIAF